MEEKLTVSEVGKKWGLIYGIIGLIYALITTIFDFGAKGMAMQAISFVVLVSIAFTVYYLACKEYKEDNRGLISFGRAFGIIALIGLIGGLIRALGTYLYIKLIDTGYIDRIKEAQEEMREKLGAPEVDPDSVPGFFQFFQSVEFIGIASFINAMLGVLIIGLIVAAIVQKNEDHSF